MADELKACPFCGGEVEKVFPPSSDLSEYIRHKGASTCPVEFTAFTLSDDLVTIWNTRADPRPAPATAWCRTCGKTWPTDENCDVCQQWWRENNPERTDPAPVVDELKVEEVDRLITELIAGAHRSSEVQRMMAEQKSLRQPGNEAGDKDLYMWPTPEQTLEGRAAAALSALATRSDPSGEWVVDPRSDLQGSAIAKVMSYNDTHEDAVEMGYLSLTEALEHLDELRTRFDLSDELVKVLKRIQAIGMEPGDYRSQDITEINRLVNAALSKAVPGCGEGK